MPRNLVFAILVLAGVCTAQAGFPRLLKNYTARDHVHGPRFDPANPGGKVVLFIPIRGGAAGQRSVRISVQGMRGLEPRERKVVQLVYDLIETTPTKEGLLAWVKAAGGEDLEFTVLTDLGFAADRVYALYNHTGQLLRARPAQDWHGEDGSGLTKLVGLFAQMALRFDFGPEPFVHCGELARRIRRGESLAKVLPEVEKIVKEDEDTPKGREAVRILRVVQADAERQREKIEEVRKKSPSAVLGFVKDTAAAYGKTALGASFRRTHKELQRDRSLKKDIDAEAALRKLSGQLRRTPTCAKHRRARREAKACRVCRHLKTQSLKRIAVQVRRFSKNYSQLGVYQELTERLRRAGHWEDK